MRLKPNKLSVVLAVFNEETNLANCLTSIKPLADQIVVVDGNSTDKTVEIAKQFGAEVIETTNKPMFHINKRMAIDAAKGDWILQLDADEEVDKELRDFIKEKILTDQERGQEESVAAYWINRRNFFLGKFLTKGGQYPDPVIRLFQKNLASLPAKDVHEQMVVMGKIGQAQGHLLHYNAPNFARYIANANRYTSLTAEKLLQTQVNMNWFNDWKYLVIKPLITFITIFGRHRGYVDGFPGLVFAWFSGLHWALAYMKLGDLYRERKQ